MTGIIWLASYPKSGNTWFRIFLANYLRDMASPVDINDLDHGAIASKRVFLDQALGIESGELSHDEVDLLRPDLYRHLAREQPSPFFCKVHDAYTWLPNGQALFPVDATRAVVYLVRNPLDVCVSLTHHNAHTDHYETARQMADDHLVSSGSTDRQPWQLRQELTSWSNHARSWLEAPGLRVHVLRYEDMHRTPEVSFGAALSFLDLDRRPERIQKALAFSSFCELEKQERAKGFRERYAAATSFFRKGQIGSWREALPSDLAQSIIEQHAPMMRRFGYLDSSGQPIF